MPEPLRSLVDAASTALGGEGEPIGAAPGAVPRFALFHAANSICSQKVRTVLAHHAIPYVSHQMNIFTGQTYSPEHVRLRMMGCRRAGLPLVSGHTGSTSVASGGCDPAVVPTLIDWELDAVLIDSKRICLHLDSIAAPQSRLYPEAHRAGIDAEIDIVDGLPNYQMLAGRPPGEDRRPGSRKGADGTGFASQKVRRCEEYLAQYAGDPVLVAAYGAKRAKEADAAQHLFTTDAMKAAYNMAANACRALDARMAARPASWLFGDRPSMADLFWIIELLRMKNMGAAALWEEGGLEAVGRFLQTGETLASVQAAVVDWPGAAY